METKYLNEILNEIDEMGFFANFKKVPDHLKKALNRLEREGLVYEKNENKYVLTNIGQDAINSGTYESWKNQVDHEVDRENKIKDLTVKQLERTIFQLKYWWVILMLSGLIGFISGNFKMIMKWVTGE